MTLSGTPNAEALAKIMFIQNMVGQLPSLGQVIPFVCRGLEGLPGISRATPAEPAQAEAHGEAADFRFPVAAGGRRYGEILLRASDADLVSHYLPYINNLCLFVAVMLEERRQRDLVAAHERELEARVRDRTRELDAEREQLAVTLRSIGDGVITTDTEGHVVIMNAVAEELTGWSTSDAAGLALADVFKIVHEISRESSENPVDRVLEHGKIVELANHTVLVSRDGIEHAIADSGAPIRDRDGKISGVVLVFRDVTEEQKSLENAQRAERLEALGILAGGIAHDFNNLLMGIFGHIEIASRSCPPGSEAAAALTGAMSSHDRARKLTRQLLTFSRGGAPHRKPRRIDEFVRECAAFALAGSKVALDVDVPPALWLCSFDAAQFSQVLENVVINARQAMPTGGKLTITFANIGLDDAAPSALAAGRYVRVTVLDEGPGIQPDVLRRLFDPFFTTKEAGTGLGLATCHSIMLRHDGCIEAESKPGEGAAFHLYMPAAEQGSEDTQEAASTAAPRAHTVSGTVLIMDDEPAIRAVLGEMLAILGFKPLAVASGGDALELGTILRDEQRPPAAVILDLTVPGGMGGLEAVEALKGLFPGVPMLASTGYAEDPVMGSPEHFGFTGSLRKPFTIAELSAVLNRYIQPSPLP